jgi:hypothetical protein
VATVRSAKGRTGRLIVAAGVVLLAASAQTRTSVAAVDLGFGKAQAQLLMLDPRSAQLSFGVRFGPTVADHRNLVARAQAQSTDYGLIGGAITGDDCATGQKAAISGSDLPQPFRADSRVPKDATERSVSEGPITQSVQADGRPFARATSRLAEADLPGILTIKGAQNTTRSGVDDDGNPFVSADVDVATISVLGGIVELGPLHWEATNRGDGKPTGLFTIGRASIGGTPIPTQDASSTVAAINNVLAQLGIVLLPPVSHVETDTIFVDPIKFGVAPNATRDLLAGEVVAALQPVREQLFQALIDASCSSGGAITVIDILLGSVTGGGSLTAVVGGAQAQFIRNTAGAQLDAGSGDAGGLDLGGTSSGDGGLVVPDVPDTTPGGTAVTTPGRAGRTAATTTAGTASDGAVAVAVCTLLLGGLLIEADRRKMRQAGTVGAAPPSVPTEAPHG